ncbi:hypothetical protein PEBR_43015 [Penicillium brasilianum]|uniref:Uncharacterized protein n=1 Tax=Penicillium brasilianum TaxID=104259 RepID=A0A1S9R9J8_PENBI|nr:hypothetical protein PEBR_43015 [Penicillium brasilianum]
MRHHKQGLEGFQKELQSIGESNLEGLMTGTMLINAFAFASLRMGELNPSMDEHSHLSEKPQSQWLNLIRGAFTIVSQSWMQIQRTRLRSLIVFNKANEYWEYFRSDLNVPIELPTGSLSGRLCAFASNASHAILALQEYSKVLDSTLAQASDNKTPEYLQTPGFDTSATTSTGGILRGQNKAIDNAEIEDAAVASWPTLVGEEFISSLDTHDVRGSAQGLLVTILAHLYLTLALLEKIWYFQGTFDLEIK